MGYYNYLNSIFGKLYFFMDIHQHEWIFFLRITYSIRYTLIIIIKFKLLKNEIINEINMAIWKFNLKIMWKIQQY